MTCNLHFLLLTLLLSSYVFAISEARPHRYGINVTLTGNTSQLAADTPDGIEQHGDDVRITAASTFKVYLQRGELAFDLCPNAECDGENHVCYPTDVVTPGATYNCGNIPSTCGYYVKMSDKKIWFTPENSAANDKTFGSCFPVIMRAPEIVYLEKSTKYSSCTPKIGEHGAVTLHVKKASTKCPLIVKNAKINPPALSSTTPVGTNEKSGTTPESSEGMAGWLIAVIVISCLIGAGLIIGAIVFVYFKVIKKSDSQPVTSTTTKKTTQPGKDQKEGQETEKSREPAAVKQEDAQMKAVNQPLSKFEEAPVKSQQPTEVKQELAKANAADPQLVQKKSKIVAAPEPTPVVKKQDCYFDLQGGNRLGFCRRMKVKSSSGRSYKKEDSMRDTVRGKYTHIFIVHVKDLAKHDPKYFDHNMIVSVLKNYPRAENILEREMKLLLKSTVDEMLVELAVMQEDAHKILTAAGVEVEKKTYEALKIPPAARKLVADPATPEFVKHYMFALEFGNKIPNDHANMESYSLSLLFVIAISPRFSPFCRRLAASCIRSNIPVVEEYWGPAERTGCYFPISAILAAEQMRGDVVIPDGRRKKKEAKKELVEASTQETGDTTVDKQCIESREPGVE